MPYSPTFGFNQPNPEAMAYLEARKLGDKTAFDWRDVWKGEHVTDFVVAKATELDVLTAIHESMHKAQEQGLPFSQFKKDLKPKLESLGWWGKGQVRDPKTGAMVDAQLGSTSRLQLIYQVNRDMAYAAAKWKRIQDTKKDFPYLIYRIGTAKNHREEHVALDGLCLPVDHPFWKRYYPPNGWLCHCFVEQVTQKQYDKYLKEGVESSEMEQEIDPTTGLPTGHVITKNIPLKTTPPKIETVEYTNPRTGKTEQVPKGIDPGFDYNVGIARYSQTLDILKQKVAAAPPEIAKPFVINFMTSFAKLYLTAVDAAISTQLAVTKQVFQFWIDTFKLGGVNRADYTFSPKTKSKYTAEDLNLKP